MDTQTLWAVIGIAVSILLFLFTYRRTIGAKRERIKTTNKEIIDGLLKRLVLEELLPSRDEIRRYISGKASEHMLRTSDLIGLEELVDSLFAQIMDNDFITPDTRRSLIEKLKPLLQADDPEEPVTAISRLEKDPRQRARSLALTLAFASAMLGSVLASFVSLMLKRTTSTAIDPKMMLLLTLGTFAGAMVAIIPILLLKRLKESQEDVRPSVEMSYMSVFEEKIATMLKHLRLEVLYSARGPYDFRVSRGEKAALIELKSGLGRYPQRYLQNLSKRLQEACERSGAQKAFIVTFHPSDERQTSRIESTNVEVCDQSNIKQKLEDYFN